MSSITLHHADCRDVLRTIPDNSIDSVVTDPPYALVSIVKRFGSPNAAPAKGNDAYMRASAGFMGKTWDTGETAFSAEFWAEVLRVLKPGGHVAAFGASRGYHRMACAIEDAGFEIRDSLMWIYGTGFPKSHDVSKGIDKAAGAEREVVAKCFRADTGRNENYGFSESYQITAPATDAAREWQGWGTALKPAFEPIVLARKPLSESTVAENVLRWRTGALNIDGCRIGTETRTYTSTGNPGANTQRFHGGDGRDPEIARAYAEKSKLRPPTTVEGRWPANVCHDGSDEVVAAFPNSAARFFYSAKASKADRAGSKHPTVKPVSLMQWLARLITPPGGTVLDPFAGSGTTGTACRLEGFNVVLIEREAEYIADIRRRLSETSLLNADTALKRGRVESILAARFAALRARLS